MFPFDLQPSKLETHGISQSLNLLLIPQRTLNINSPSSISNCCIVSVQGEIICMVESTLSTPKCLVLSSNITSSLADNHHLIASVVVVLTPRTLPMSTQGKHFHIFVAYVHS